MRDFGKGDRSFAQVSPFLLHFLIDHREKLVSQVQVYLSPYPKMTSSWRDQVGWVGGAGFDLLAGTSGIRNLALALARPPGVPSAPPSIAPAQSLTTHRNLVKVQVGVL